MPNYSTWIKSKLIRSIPVFFQSTIFFFLYLCNYRTNSELILDDRTKPLSLILSLRIHKQLSSQDHLEPIDILSFPLSVTEKSYNTALSSAICSSVTSETPSPTITGSEAKNHHLSHWLAAHSTIDDIQTPAKLTESAPSSKTTHEWSNRIFHLFIQALFNIDWEDSIPLSAIQLQSEEKVILRFDEHIEYFFL